MKLIKYFSYILIILTLSFVLPRIIPGSPLHLSDSDTYALNTRLPMESFSLYEEYYAPDKPLVQQFIIYIRNLAKLDLGYSFYYKMPVGELLFSRIAWTIFLSVTSIIISSIVGIRLGLNTALNTDEKIKNAALISFTSIQAVPAFIMAVLIQLLLSYKLNLFPSSGAYSAGVEFFTFNFFVDVIVHSILPLITLVIIEIPSIFLLTYNVASRIKKSNYVKMAYYLNINHKIIQDKYIFINSIPEILGKLNIQFLYAISGTLFVEAVFSYPGMGMFLKTAAVNNDYPLLQGILLFIGIYGILINGVFENLIKRYSPRISDENN
ncbi:MAG: ABC transporter permease [Solirubrobacterales bacterium]